MAHVKQISFKENETALIDLLEEKYGKISFSTYVKHLIKQDLGIKDFVCIKVTEQPKEKAKEQQQGYNVDEEREDLDL